MVQAALLTGCRYGELALLRVYDFDGEAGTTKVWQAAFAHFGRSRLRTCVPRSQFIELPDGAVIEVAGILRQYPRP
jgi:hypothetical protein